MRGVLLGCAAVLAAGCGAEDAPLGATPPPVPAPAGAPPRRMPAVPPMAAADAPPADSGLAESPPGGRAAGNRVAALQRRVRQLEVDVLELRHQILSLQRQLAEAQKSGVVPVEELQRLPLEELVGRFAAARRGKSAPQLAFALASAIVRGHPDRPEAAAAFEYLVGCYWRSGSKSRVWDLRRELVRRIPGSAEALRARIALAAQARQQGTAEAARRWLAPLADHPKLYHEYVGVLRAVRRYAVASGDVAFAEQLVERVLALEGEARDKVAFRAQVGLMRGKLYHAVGNRDAAAAAYQAVIDAVKLPQGGKYTVAYAIRLNAASWLAKLQAGEPGPD